MRSIVTEQIEGLSVKCKWTLAVKKGSSAAASECSSFPIVGQA